MISILGLRGEGINGLVGFPSFEPFDCQACLRTLCIIDDVSYMLCIDLIKTFRIMCILTGARSFDI